MITIEEANQAVNQFELMKYFHLLSPEARNLVAEELMAMCNWPKDRILRNAHGETIPYIHPRVRLAWLMLALKPVDEWPGMAQIRGLFCKRFKPADGIEVASCNIPGYTDEECESAHLSLPLPAYIPQPGDEPMGDEIPKQIAKAAKVKRIASGKE